MGVNIHIHPDMYYLADGREVIEVTGNTVGECLTMLISLYPGLGELIFYKDGQLQTFLEIYVNRTAAYPNELERVVKDGDDIYLMLTIAGG
jgi:molybdopterin converting factor small subunit